MQRKGAGRKATVEPDVEAALDELYTTLPSAFVSRREELAATARTAGRPADARRIHAARRPTLAAWAANLLLRSSPKESLQFLRLGQSLRDAYSTLDAAGLKELSAQRRHVITVMSRQAAELARQAGYHLSFTVQLEVESTLRAVLADPDAAALFAAGRLESTLTPPSDFPTLTTAAAEAPRKPSRPAPAQSATRTPAKEDLTHRRREHRQRLDQAREAAEAAEERLRERRAEHDTAEAALTQARDRHDRAKSEAGAAEQRLQRTREELQQAVQEQRQAAEAHQAAAAALARAEQEAREAAADVDRLAQSAP